MGNVSVVVIVILVSVYARTTVTTEADQNKCPRRFGYMCEAGNGKRSSLGTGNNARTNTKNVRGTPRAFLPNWLQRRTLYNVQRRLLQQLARHTRVVDTRPGSAITKNVLWPLVPHSSKSDQSSRGLLHAVRRQRRRLHGATADVILR